MKESYIVKEELQTYLKYLKTQISKVNPHTNQFTEGKISGIKSAIDFIDGYLYYRDGELYNK